MEEIIQAEEQDLFVEHTITWDRDSYPSDKFFHAARN